MNRPPFLPSWREWRMRVFICHLFRYFVELKCARGHVFILHSIFGYSSIYTKYIIIQIFHLIEIKTIEQNRPFYFNEWWRITDSYGCGTGNDDDDHDYGAGDGRQWTSIFRATDCSILLSFTLIDMYYYSQVILQKQFKSHRISSKLKDENAQIPGIPIPLLSWHPIIEI